MDFELHPAITLGFRAFHILVAPVQMLVEALNRHLNLQRFEVLYVCGNYSCILSGLDRRFTALAMKEASKSSIVLLYSTASDPFLEEMINYSDRVFYFAEGPRATARPSAKNCRKAQAGFASQTTLGTF